MNIRKLSLTVLFTLFLPTLSVIAQSNPDRKTLVGLSEIGVVVESLTPEAERAGLTESQLQTDVELRLRKAGIRVVDSSLTYLYIVVTVLKNNDYAFGYSLKVSFNQPVILERNKSISTIASTWDRIGVGVVASSKLQSVRENVGDYVDKFINDYLAANPSSAAAGKNYAPHIDFSDVIKHTEETKAEPQQDDPGIDVAYVIATKANLRESPYSTNIVLQPEQGDLLALVDRTPKANWYNVIHVRSGKEGWVDRSAIEIRYTEKPRPAPVFEERRVAGDKDPELIIQNKTDRVLTLRLGDNLYSIPANSERSVTVSAGTYKFYGSVPNAYPTFGEKNYQKGIVFTWWFYINTAHK